METKDLHSCSIEVRAIDEPRTVECVMSDETIDAYGDIVDVSSWKLDRFKKNPIVLAYHNTRSLPVGRAENIRIEGKQLRCRIAFAGADVNPEAERIYQAIRQGYMKGVSVSFSVGRSENTIRQGKEVRILFDCELFELSCTPLPANPSALIKSAGQAASTAATEGDVLEHLHSLASPEALAMVDEFAANERELKALHEQLEKAGASPGPLKKGPDLKHILDEIMEAAR